MMFFHYWIEVWQEYHEGISWQYGLLLVILALNTWLKLDLPGFLL